MPAPDSGNERRPSLSIESVVWPAAFPLQMAHPFQLKSFYSAEVISSGAVRPQGDHETLDDYVRRIVERLDDHIYR